MNFSNVWNTILLYWNIIFILYNYHQITLSSSVTIYLNLWIIWYISTILEKQNMDFAQIIVIFMIQTIWIYFWFNSEIIQNFNIRLFDIKLSIPFFLSFWNEITSFFLFK